MRLGEKIKELEEAIELNATAGDVERSESLREEWEWLRELQLKRELLESLLNIDSVMKQRIEQAEARMKEFIHECEITLEYSELTPIEESVQLMNKNAYELVVDVLKAVKGEMNDGESVKKDS